jgi:hypothetical protein
MIALVKAYACMAAATVVLLGLAIWTAKTFPPRQ